MKDGYYVSRHEYKWVFNHFTHKWDLILMEWHSWAGPNYIDLKLLEQMRSANNGFV